MRVEKWRARTTGRGEYSCGLKIHCGSLTIYIQMGWLQRGFWV